MKPTFRCSELSRFAKCPGSWAASRNMPSKDSKQSSVGTEAHKRLQYYFTDWSVESVLNVAGLDSMTAYRVKTYAENAIEAANAHGGIKYCYPEKELRLDMGTFFLVGHIDLLIDCNDGTTLIFDWKFNFLDVDTAGDNIQTLGYAAIAWAPHDVEVYLFAAGNEDEEDRYTMSKFDQDTICRGAIPYIRSICESAMRDDAPRCPSESACRYCPSKCSVNCQETMDIATTGGDVAIWASTLPASVDKVADLFNKAQYVKKLADSLIDRIKEAVKESPDVYASHFKIQPTGATREIIDVQDAYHLLVTQESIMSHIDFMDCLKASITKIEEKAKPVIMARGFKAGDVKQIIENMLYGNIEKKEKQPTVKVF